MSLSRDLARWPLCEVDGTASGPLFNTLFRGLTTLNQSRGRIP